MHLLRLEIENFRNIKKASLEFPPGAQLLIGGNAQGKTSLLEAVYFLATATSHRTRSNRELIRWGSPSAFLRAEYRKAGRDWSLTAGFSEKERRFRLDGEALARSSDLYGNLRVVFFAPEDLEFLAGGPTFRRRMLDLSLCQRFPHMVRVLLDYRKALKQRNSALRGGDSSVSGKALVRAWDRELARLGALVIHSRASHALELLDQTAGHYHDLTLSAEVLSGEYRSSGTRAAWSTSQGVPLLAEIEAAFLETLVANLDRDLAYRLTTCGPHRDDLVLRIDGRTAEKYASQGQRRSIALSLKLAERDLLLERDEPPILLVDDVTHEMDIARCTRFLEKVSSAGQALLTFTEEEAHRGVVREATRWRVSEGEVRLIPSDE
ncbi:MAG: DNA replication/repair protein RecF [Candidatus Omnitrophica bacterium]|nr:DNA replication/repair protein RecF [Candidatus Omnitrophota bacterium]